MQDFENSNLISFFSKLNSIHRSISSPGNLETLKFIKDNYLPTLKIKSVEQGEKIFDWTIPKQWKVNKALVKNGNGKIIINFDDNFLHLVSFSNSFKGKLSKEEFLEHVFYLDDDPDSMPYRTSYYSDFWGFQ